MSSFGFIPHEPLGVTTVPAQAYLAYRKLSYALLADSTVYERYLVVGTAVSDSGVMAFVEKTLTGAVDALRKLSGIEVVVREIGPIVSAAHGGDSTGAARGRQPSGTYGCLVEDHSRKYGLSCDHVIGDLAGQALGDPVWSPGKARGGTSNSRIGVFGRGSGVVLSSSASNKVDGALITLDKPSVHPQSISGILGAPAGVNHSISFGDTLKKFGVATGVTSGQFSYIVTMNVPYSGGRARFVDQIGIDGGGVVFADAGDSGAVVLDDSNAVVGLLFAAAPQSCLGFANPISDVEAVLGVTVV
jgi:hypothetical protein